MVNVTCVVPESPSVTTGSSTAHVGAACAPAAPTPSTSIATAVAIAHLRLRRVPSRPRSPPCIARQGSASLGRRAPVQIPSATRTSVRIMERTPAKHHPRGGLAREELERLVAQDLTVREIAAAVDRSFTTVRYWLRQVDLETTREARTKRGRGTESQPRFEDDCAKHGRTVFARRRNGAAQCLRCRAEAVTAWRRRAKRSLVEEAGGACLLCGFDAYAGALHFHHVDPTQKRFGVGGRGLARSIEALREE